MVEKRFEFLKEYANKNYLDQIEMIVCIVFWTFVRF